MRLPVKKSITLDFDFHSTRKERKIKIKKKLSAVRSNVERPFLLTTPSVIPPLHTLSPFFLSSSESILHELGNLLKQTQFAKDNIGWDLLALEALGIDSEREPDSDDESEDGGPIPEDSDSDSCSSSSSSSSSISSPSLSSSSGSSGEAPNINTIQRMNE